MIAMPPILSDTVRITNFYNPVTVCKRLLSVMRTGYIVRVDVHSLDNA